MRRSSPWPLVGLVSMVLVSLLAAPGCGAQEVILSLDRFHELWKKAHPPAVPPPPATGSLALEAAELAIVVDGEVARLSTSLQVTLRGELPQVLLLPELGAFLEVEGGGPGAPKLELALVRQEGKPLLRLLGEGRHTIRLESVLPAPAQAAAVTLERRLELELPKAARVTGSLTVGSEVQQTQASSGGLLLAQGPGRFRWVGDPGARLVLLLSGAPRVVAKSESALPLVFEVDTASALLGSRARLRLTSWLVVRVVQGELESLRVPLPSGFEVLGVSGEKLLGWEIREGRLELALREATKGALGFEVQLTADPSLELAPPVLVPEGAKQVRRAVKVALRSSDGLLETVERLGAEPLAASDTAPFGPGFEAAPGEPLRLTGASSPLWRVTWAASGEVVAAQIDRLVVDAVVGETGTVRMRLWAEIRNGEPSLTVVPPPGARLVRALRGNTELTLGERGDAWVVPMVVQVAPQVVYLEAIVDGVFPRAGGRLILPLPKLSVPASRVEVRLLAPPGFEYHLAEGTAAGAVRPPPGGSGGTVSVPGPSGLLAAPLGFSTLEASWSAWSMEPPPLVVEVRLLERRSR